MCVCVLVARSYTAISSLQKSIKTHPSCECVYLFKIQFGRVCVIYILFQNVLCCQCHFKCLFQLSIYLPPCKATCMSLLMVKNWYISLSYAIFTHILHNPAPLLLSLCSLKTEIDDKGSCPIISCCASGTDERAGISLP